MALETGNNSHVYRPSNEARTFFVNFGCFQLLLGAWLLSIALPEWLKTFGSSVSGSVRLVVSLPILFGCFLVISGVLGVRMFWMPILKLSMDAVEVEFLFGLLTGCQLRHG